MSDKRILVIDDDPDLLFLVAHGVKSLSPNYQVSTATGAAGALEQARQQSFDLVVTDYMMPEMTGLELIPKIRQISPDSQFIIITAHHDTVRIRNSIEAMNISGFVSKPFMLPELLDTVQAVLRKSEASRSANKKGETIPKKDFIAKVMRGLHRQTNAMTILLVDTEGQPVHVVGDRDSAKISRLASFVASNFLAITELTMLFGENDSTFKSSYYEGNNYNIYAYNINGDFFLTVVARSQVKPGTVWFYTKQAASVLEKFFPFSGKTKLPAEARNNLVRDFDHLLGDKTERDSKES